MIILFGLLIVSLMATLVLMHEDAIADKYVIWLEGWDSGLLTSLGVALRGSGGDSKQAHPEMQNVTQESVKVTTTTASTDAIQETK